MEEDYCNEVNEIMGHIPHWIIRWGILIIAVVFLSIIVGCYFIKYPQVVDSSIIITTINPPSQLIARHTGLIDSLSVNNGDIVNKGDYIAGLKSSVNYNHIKLIETELSSFKINNIDSIVFSDWIYDNYSLGNVQASWLNFVAACYNYKNYLDVNYLGNRIKMIDNLLKKKQDYHTVIVSQSNSYKNKLSLTNGNLRTDSNLFRQGVISKFDLENSKQDYYSAESAYASALSNVISTEVSMIELQQNKEELVLQLKQESYDLEKNIIQCKEQLLADINLWREDFVFESPIAGVVSFNDVWKENQSISSGKVFATIIPSDEVYVIGKVKVGSDRFGEVAVGQDVIVKLNGYPYMEYGVLYGKVSAISEMPEVADGKIYYNVDVDFGNSLITNYKKQLPLIQYMDGSAEIITKEKRLLEYFVEPILYLITEVF